MALRRDFRIRDARSDELDEIGRVTIEAYREYANRMRPEAWQAYVRNIADVQGRFGEAEVIVAEVSGRIVGTITFYPNGAPAEDEGWPAGWAGLRLLAVLPEFRGQGIGRALVEEGIRRAGERGATTVGLHTTETMAVARALYERMGFRRAPEYDFKPSPDVLVMAYRLDL